MIRFIFRYYSSIALLNVKKTKGHINDVTSEKINTAIFIVVPKTNINKRFKLKRSNVNMSEVISFVMLFDISSSINKIAINSRHFLCVLHAYMHIINISDYAN